ncbi:hypothetical protein KP509_14G049100 [Ceratopteris richardii]|uniref:Uncharacterized protein n=1 Tax=Ceratopteris richardii TaxID=49495 RepID=A0A8T2TEM1_CERRI|nr:hypothetical protein KP509_14G049100 [Ceratopteris richardii]
MMILLPRGKDTHIFCPNSWKSVESYCLKVAIISSICNFTLSTTTSYTLVLMHACSSKIPFTHAHSYVHLHLLPPCPYKPKPTCIHFLTYSPTWTLARTLRLSTTSKQTNNLSSLEVK